MTSSTSENSVFHSFKKEIKKALSLSIPLISSQLVYASSGFIGTAMVAQLGEDALAASVLVSMVWYALSVFFFGILNAVGVLISHQYGAKDYPAMSETMGQSVLLGMIVCISLILILLMVPSFLHFSSQPPVVLKLAMEYTYAMLWTVPGLVVLVIYEQFLAGINRAKIVLRISLLVVPIEIPLIYLLVFGKLGLPQCGVAGVGYGFAVTYTLTAIGLVYYLFRAKQYRPYKLFAQINRIKIRCWKEMISVGLPMGFMHVIEVTTFAVATFGVAQFGTNILAAHQIALQYLGFVITVVFAMAQAMTVRVGHAVGEQDLAGIRYAIYVGMALSFCCIVVVALAFMLFPTFFIQLDLDIYDPKNTRLVQATAALLSISGVLLIFDNFRIIGFGALRGLKETRFPMYASFVGFWLVGLSSAFIFGFYFAWSGRGVWWGLTLGIASGAVMVLVKLHYLLQRIDLTKLASSATIDK